MIIRFRMVGWIYFLQFILRHQLCLHLTLHHLQHVYCASSSMMNLYSMFLYKFQQIIPNLNSRKSKCVNLCQGSMSNSNSSSPTVRTWAPNNSTLWPSGLAALMCLQGSTVSSTLVALLAAVWTRSKPTNCFIGKPGMLDFDLANSRTAWLPSMAP
ncbi:hypothetical protein PVAP13_4NG119385 [Panicum virgatum]|uniref:Uncharacterized protein n=1 Tax=Panicum virgatum TaxID=38727 RepID=A0A8T0T5Q9_PANVG|nr:hypothetical protein PVAP13_4NG119385 [Panicum virgatum]